MRIVLPVPQFAARALRAACMPGPITVLQVVAALHPAGPPRGSRHEAHSLRRSRRPHWRISCPCFSPPTLRAPKPRRAGRVAAGRHGGGGLRPDPAAGHPSISPTWLSEHSRLVTAALAWRCTDPPRVPRRRCQNRRRHHADGSRARYGSSAAGDVHRDRSRETTGELHDRLATLGAEAIVLMSPPAVARSSRRRAAIDAWRYPRQ